MKNRKVVTYLCKFSIIALFVLISGCTANEEPEDPNENALANVLEYLLVGPDEELIELMNDPDNITVIGKGVEREQAGEKNGDKPTELDDYLQELYGSYFSNNVYQDFVNAHAWEFQIMMDQNNYEMTIDTMDIEETDEQNNRYDFTVDVTYIDEHENDEDAEQAKVKGYVNFSKENKITRFRLTDDGGLLTGG